MKFGTDGVRGIANSDLTPSFAVDHTPRFPVDMPPPPDPTKRATILTEAERKTKEEKTIRQRGRKGRRGRRR